MRRIVWFILGAVAGASAVVWVRRTAGAVAEKLTPSALLAELRSVVAALWSKAKSLTATEPER